jgi:hypothetical protein
MGKALLAIAIILFHFSLQAKDTLSVNIGVKGHHGIILIHRENMAHLAKGRPHFFEISTSSRVSGNKNWHQVYNKPEVGFSLLYCNLQNPTQLGYGIAAFPHINFPLNKREFLNLNLRLGIGIAYVSRIFHHIENHKNNAISTHLNGSINFQLENTINITNRLSMRNGIGFTHFSNGAYRMPNLGINLATLNSGLHYQFGQTKTPARIETQPSREIVKKTANFSVIGTVGFKSLYVLSPVYPVYTLRSSYDKMVSDKSAFGVGFDVVYNSSLTEKLMRMEGISVNSMREIIQPGINLSYALVVDNLSIYINKGVYLTQVDKQAGLFYHRIGMKYRCNNRIVANVSLKSHFAVADHFEYGIGYSF